MVPRGWWCGGTENEGGLTEAVRQDSGGAEEMIRETDWPVGFSAAGVMSERGC
jgi:hypothetical protein